MWKRWRVFHATDFQSLMYPCFTVCRILGIFPYKINASTFEFSKPRYILSTVVICVYCIYDLTLIHSLISNYYLQDVTKSLEAACYYVCCGLIMIVTHVLSGPRMRLLQTIWKISSGLPLKSYQKLSISIYAKDILSIISVIVQICVYFSKAKMFYSWNVLAMLFTIYCILLIFQANMLYINCVYVLKACFQNINDNLSHMQRLVVNDTKLRVSTLIGHMQRNQFSLMELKTLKKWHLMVSDAVQMLNIIFSLQLLATIVIIFSNVTFELYFFIVRWQDGLLISFDKRLFDTFLMVLTYHITQIALLVWVCETGKNQAQEICTTIHDLLNNTSDEQIKDELHLFSIQILHRKNTFSAKGLTVDATLLTEMVGSITTYMLILIQFLLTSHSCDRKSILHK